MATLFHDGDADLHLLASRRVAVIGYGSQGHAHALNLRDSGLDVRVGLPHGSARRSSAMNAGLRVLAPSAAVSEAELVVLLVPDHVQGDVYREVVEPNLRRGGTLLFAHGFSIRFGAVTPRDDLNVSLVAPKSPGHRLRELFREGAGAPGLVAVHQDRTGGAMADALAYAKGIGCTRAGVIATTFAEETETDLFGEQAVLCGGLSALVKAGFETLVEHGYQPEIAYFECLHELKLIVDLLYTGGFGYMRDSISDTAEYGDYQAGSRIVTEDTRLAMRDLLARVRDGSFAREWLEENRRGRRELAKRREAEATHRLEVVGREMRQLMPFLAPANEPQVPVHHQGDGAS